MNTYTKALMFAAKAHAGQKRRNGDNYIVHVIRVSQSVHTEKQKIAALLHDTVEDTETTLDDIKDEFGWEMAEIIDCLSMRKGKENHDEYIERVMKNEDAIAVKIADIGDNLGDSPSPRAIEKNAIAIEKLVRASQTC